MSTSNSSGNDAPPMYFCHMCSMEMRPLMTPQPTCPRCNGGFVEELDASSDLRQGRGIGDGDAEEDTDIPFWSGDPSGIHTQGPGFDIGQLMTNVLRNLANAGQDANTDRSTPTNTNNDQNSESANPQSQQSSSSGPSNNIRFGSTRIGPVGVTWGVGSHTFNSGGASASNPFNRDPLQREAQQDHFHDDGMGGAGAAADGRFFNHDNNDNGPSNRMPGADPSSDEPNLPPELASLREIFSNLFGGVGDGPAGSLIDMFGNAFRGRTGDYVWGQQGLDDVISQLMEQTRGSTAPPPASDEAIAKLAKFSRKDIEKVREARNRECSTCMDSFEEEGSDLKPDATKDSNLPTGLSMDNAEADDPPETAPEEEQQDELVMMPCKHLFHEDCLIPWLKNSGTCPVCRVTLEPKKASENSESQIDQNAAGPSTTFSSIFSTNPSGTVELNTHSNRPVSSSGMVHEREDTDIEDEDEEMEDDSAQRRERMRRAAEARANGSNTIPGSFLPPADDLD